MLLDYTYPQPSCGAVIKRCHFLPLPPLTLSLSLCLGAVLGLSYSILYSLLSVLCCALCVSIVWQLALFPLNWNCALASTLITIFVRPMLNFKLKTLIRIILVVVGIVVVAVVWLRLHCQCAAKVRHLSELWAHLWPPPLETLPELGLYTESWRKTLPQELDACSTYLSASVRVWQQQGQQRGSTVGHATGGKCSFNKLKVLPWKIS